MSSCQKSCACAAKVSEAAANHESLDPVASGLVLSTFFIPNMDCPNEEREIRVALEKIEGVARLDFDLPAYTLRVHHTSASLERIVSSLQKIGYPPQPKAEEATHAEHTHEQRTKLGKIWLALAAAAVAEVLHFTAQAPHFILAFALFAIALSGGVTFLNGIKAMARGRLSIDALMVIAVSGAMILGEWPEAAMVMVLFELAERLEARAIWRSQQTLRELLQSAPQMARRLLPDGSLETVAVAQVRIGDQVQVLAGEAVPLDGVLLSGRGSLNQAALTGESFPADKNVGDTVLAGSVNEDGAFVLEVTQAAENSTYARLLRAVEEAQQRQAHMQRLVDRFAAFYTPLIVVLALLLVVVPPLVFGEAWQPWIYRALTVLVVACPCAFVLATPVTMMSALSFAARRGLLIRGGEVLERAAAIDVLAFDKTGTLTRGEPEQVAFGAAAEVNFAMVYPLALGLANLSTHPIARAMMRAAHGVEVWAMDDFCNLPGRGVSAKLSPQVLGALHDVSLSSWHLAAGDRFYLLNARELKLKNMMNAELIAQISEHEKLGHSLVFLASERQVLAWFAFADTLHDEAKEAVAALQHLGLSLVILSGDHRASVAQVAHELGITAFHAELLPEDKMSHLDQLSTQGKVAMVGDGMNDAPALARADLGVAMARSGSALAVETAHVAVMDDDLRKLPRLFSLARRARSILWQNILLALLVKFVFLLLVFAGLGTMWMAVFADVGTSLLVIGNALRLTRHRDVF